MVLFQNCGSVRMCGYKQTRGVAGCRIYKKGKNRTLFLLYEFGQHCFHRSRKVLRFRWWKTRCNSAGPCWVCWYVRFPTFFPFVLQLQIVMTLLIISACDYLNSKREHWVPILAILCDGEKFEFLVYDSGVKSVYSSDMVTDVLDLADRPKLLAPSLKMSKVTNNLPPFRYWLFSISYRIHFWLLSHGLHQRTTLFRS